MMIPIKSGVLAAACATMLLSMQASAATYLFTYTGPTGSNVTAAGTITTGQANPSGSFYTPSELITGITGTFNGSEITALLPRYTFLKTSGIFGSPGNDNVLYYPATSSFNNLPTYLDRYGVGFSTASNWVNLYFGAGGYGLITGTTSGTNATSTPVGGTFTVTPTLAVPEPASWAMMLVGFAMLGAAIRYRAGRTGITFA